jgi:hypothetical protein
MRNCVYWPFCANIVFKFGHSVWQFSVQADLLKVLRILKPRITHEMYFLSWPHPRYLQTKTIYKKLKISLGGGITGESREYNVERLKKVSDSLKFVTQSFNWVESKAIIRLNAVCDEVQLLDFFSQIYNLLYNGAISKYVVRKHLCGAIIQWWFSFIYRNDNEIYSSSSVIWFLNLTPITSDSVKDYASITDRRGGIKLLITWS